MNRFTVGSRAFFSNYEDFTPHDTDILLLEDNPTDYKYCSQLRIKGNCYFRWKRMSKEEFIALHDEKASGLLLGKFLVPEFAKEIELTIEDLKRLSNLLEKLDDKHTYEKIIYNSYLENGDFYLTDEQRKKAYDEYKEKRKNHSE